MDEDPRPGSFILSGSSRFLTIPTLSESLVGRAAVLDLWPLSVAERAGVWPQLIDQILTDHASLRALPPSPLTRRTAQPVKAAPLAESLGLDHGTVARYLPLLEQVYLIHFLPAWSNNLTARATRTPKMHFVDTGVVARLINRSPQSLAESYSIEAGAIFETFVVNEILKQAALAESEVQLFHYRDRDGAEIDCVLETPDRRIVGIETKLALTVNEADLRHLRAMRDRQGERFICGLLIYCGQHVIPFGDRLLAVPASALWSGSPVPDSLND